MPGDGGPRGKGKQTGMWSEGKEIGLLSDMETGRFTDVKGYVIVMF